MHPLRNVAGVFRRADGSPVDPTPPATAAATAPPAAYATPNNPFAWSGDDPVSRAVRAGCDVVEQAVRRGFGVPGERSGPAWAGGLFQGPWTGPWSTGQWVDAMTGALTQWAQWMDAWSSMVRTAMGGEAQGTWPPAPAGSRAPAAPPYPPPASSAAASPASSSGTGAAGALRLTLELRTARAASVELDLLPGATTAFEVHGLLAPPAAAAPPITDVTLAIVDGGVHVTLGSIDQHPAGVYAGAVLAAGRACGTLTVRLT